MFDIYYYADPEGERELLHSPIGKGNKILSGTLSESLNNVPTVDFTIGANHTLFSRILPFKGVIQVINRLNNQEVFYGRILKPTGTMTQSGLFTQSYLAEGPLSFLNDSTQPYQRLPYHSEQNWLEVLIYEHNLQTERYKHFIVGEVDVEDVEAPAWHYWAQEPTFDVLKKRMDKLGGYITVKREGEYWRIDWKREVGEFINEPIQLGKNIKTSSRSNTFDNMITRLEPLGIENGIPWSDTDASTSRLGISEANGGVPYIDDVDLVNQFGIIHRPVTFEGVRLAKTLLDAGQTFLDEQHKYLTSWDVTVADLSLIDVTKQPFVVGNTHPVNNPPIASVENQQIVSKETDLLRPQSPVIKLGAIERTISSYYNQMQRNLKSLHDITQRKPEREEEETTNEFEDAESQEQSPNAEENEEPLNKEGEVNGGISI